MVDLNLKNSHHPCLVHQRISSNESHRRCRRLLSQTLDHTVSSPSPLLSLGEHTPLHTRVEAKLPGHAYWIPGCLLSLLGCLLLFQNRCWCSVLFFYLLSSLRVFFKAVVYPLLASPHIIYHPPFSSSLLIISPPPSIWSSAHPSDKHTHTHTHTHTHAHTHTFYASGYLHHHHFQPSKTELRPQAFYNPQLTIILDEVRPPQPPSHYAISAHDCTDRHCTCMAN